MLLERSGELVTREELRQALWASDTFVDFEHGLSAAVNKLRQVLSDNAETPRYIETLPRRGYRFIGVITSPVEEPVGVTVGEEQQEGPPRGTRRRNLWALGLGGVALCWFAVAIFAWVRSPGPAPRIVGYRQLTTDRRAKGQPCDGASASRVVSDGARIFFSEDGYGLMQVSANGGEVAPVANSFACFEVFDISPDKTELLGASVTDPTLADNPIWGLLLASGLGHRIGDLSGHAAAYSPDGQMIAFATGSQWGAPNELHIAEKDGSNVRTLAQVDAGVVVNIFWSPDGKSLRMGVSMGSAKNSVWRVELNGGNLHLVRRLPEAGCCFLGMDWTGGQKYLLAGVEPGIWAFRETGIFAGRSGADTQLTTGPVSYRDPAFSRDGREVFAIGGRPRGELVRYDWKSQTLQPFLSGISAEHLDFSRDGQWVTYVSFPEGILWRSRVDGSERLQLTAVPLTAVLPRWSPDGTRIAFSAWLPGGDPKIYIVSRDGGNPEAILPRQQGTEVDATWMADGNGLVFGGPVFDAQSKIAKVDLATRQVTVIAGSEGMNSPRVSPSGRFIYAEKSGGRMFLFDQETGQWSEVPEKSSGSSWPQWSSDSKYVYLGRDPELRAGSFHVSRLRVSDRKIEPVAVVNVPEGLVGVWGGWMSTAPDGTPVLLRDLSIQEIYALDVDLP
jgi:Tol biopolymer transport system component